MNKQKFLEIIDYKDICNNLTDNEISQFNNKIQNSNLDFFCEIELKEKKIILKIPLEYVGNCILFRIENK